MQINTSKLLGKRNEIFRSDLWWICIYSGREAIFHVASRYKNQNAPQLRGPSGAVVNSLRECSALVFSLHPGSNRWWVERKHVFLYLRHSEFFLFSVSNRTTRSFGECAEDFKELRHCILSNFRHSEFSQSTVQF